MSLDVWLTLKGQLSLDVRERIFIREGGCNKEISREEWDRQFPGQEPVVLQAGVQEDAKVYSGNITHNLNTMASKAGIYEYLWRPDELGITKAKELIEPLETGLDMLKSDPYRFRVFNPPNGWGTYEVLVEFVTEYLAACRKFPDAEVGVWR